MTLHLSFDGAARKVMLEKSMWEAEHRWWPSFRKMQSKWNSKGHLAVIIMRHVEVAVRG